MRVSSIGAVLILMTLCVMSPRAQSADATREREKREETIKQLEKQVEKAEGKAKKVERKNHLGQYLADTVIQLNSKARSLADDAEKNAGKARMVEAIRKERDALRKKIDALWGDDKTFALIPASIVWRQPARQGIRYAEYMSAETIDRKALHTYLHTKRVEWRNVSLKGKRSQQCVYDRKKNRFRLNLTSNREVAVFFYIRAVKERKATIRIRLKSKDDRISAIYVNNQRVSSDEGESCKTKARLREGGNIAVIYFKNTDKPELAFEIQVEGKALQVGSKEE